MGHPKNLLILLCWLLISMPLQAKQGSHSLLDKVSANPVTDPDIIATVNDLVVTRLAAETMLSAINKGKQSLTLNQLVQGIIENQLIADYSKKHIGLDEVLPESLVDYELDVALEDQYISVINLAYNKQIHEFIEMSMKKLDMESWVEKPRSFTAKELSQYTQLKSKGNLKLTDQQTEAAKALVLTQYHFPGDQTGAITLWDIYRRQNIQGKDQLHQANNEFLQAEIRKRINSKLIDYWARKHSPLNENDLASLKTIIFNKHHKQRYLATQGLVNLLHVDNKKLREVAKTIPQKEITAYFNKHKDDYIEVEKARGFVIRSADRDLLKEISQKANKGTSLETLLAEYSKTHPALKESSGDTGWVGRKDIEDIWMQTLIFTLPKNDVSRPMRSPQIPNQEIYWAIIRVDDRETGYPSPESKGIRYEVGKILAAKKMAKEFKQLSDQLFLNANIAINPSLVDIKSVLSFPAAAHHFSNPNEAIDTHDHGHGHAH